MRKETLGVEEKQLVGRCLYEAVNGSYFPEWEFETLIGADKAVVRNIASNWLTGNTNSRGEIELTLSVLNNLMGYPHDRATELERAVGAKVSEIERVFARLDG